MSEHDEHDEHDDEKDVQVQEAIEHTEKTGEVNPSGLWPEGDQGNRTPV